MNQFSLDCICCGTGHPCGVGKEGSHFYAIPGFHLGNSITPLHLIFTPKFHIERETKAHYKSAKCKQLQAVRETLSCWPCTAALKHYLCCQ